MNIAVGSIVPRDSELLHPRARRAVTPSYAADGGDGVRTAEVGEGEVSDASVGLEEVVDAVVEEPGDVGWVRVEGGEAVARDWG